MAYSAGLTKDIAQESTAYLGYQQLFWLDRGPLGRYAHLSDCLPQHSHIVHTFRRMTRGEVPCQRTPFVDRWIGQENIADGTRNNFRDGSQLQ